MVLTKFMQTPVRNPTVASTRFLEVWFPHLEGTFPLPRSSIVGNASGFNRPLSGHQSEPKDMHSLPKFAHVFIANYQSFGSGAQA